MFKGIRLTNTEIKHIALFESITGATVRDCIIDEEFNRIIFVIKEGDAGIAIGKGGKNLSLLEKMTGKKHEIIEFSEDPAQFIKNALKPARVREIRISEKPNGETVASVHVDPRDKGIAIGKNGKNAEKVRLLAKKYFQISNVSIV
ncbi:MAG: NusA-like transcription termination signal-binding factor [Nitrososphaerota archaeon]|nr:NusA-like transcription termination signal-binding factor [Candidatus Bathyarchaeota archaeon]MDW8049344.1 NusA-like transcription termination signal-binding factor [Nitrososphaerota archaeon]